MLSVDGLDVHAGPVRLVRDVSFGIGPGERVGLIGESGSGKSLTALSLMGLLPEGVTASGRATLDGDDLVGVPERRLKRLRGREVSMVFQEPMTALNPLMRVGAQVAEVMTLHGRPRAEARERAVHLLGRVRLPRPEQIARAYPHQLSGGQRQRVMLAIALANEPRLLICDEPTTALDVTVQKQMLELIAEVAPALLFITHDLAVVASVCERVVVMYGGRVVESGPIREVFTNPRHRYTEGLLAASRLTPRGTRLPTIKGSVPAAGGFPDGCVFRNRCPHATEACEQEPALTGDGHAFACWHPAG
ncbi:ABC transporter ATP-binding protein [Nonomuraea pusilla]|uniref:Oligopeptide/dipeptide transporter, C-terminal region n=1 Tax=Nonomuraea pusilla TaxID=46177 RepID=A0A1H7TLZ4_9ACTN|nr:ABC transporter ATP-binding protein [Nonomuraea pusilla]SEL85585.1 Oligopeptide/dipeptide transporter, C-terminal region [Nonomuraea pusilla]